MSSQVNLLGSLFCLQVEFKVAEVKKDNSARAVNIVVLNRNGNTRKQGFLAVLKENFGFIETADHDREVFFHYR